MSTHRAGRILQDTASRRPSHRGGIAGQPAAASRARGGGRVTGGEATGAGQPLQSVQITSILHNSAYQTSR